MPIRTSLGARRWSDESSAKKMSKNSLTKADLHPLCLSKRPVTAVCYCQRAGVLTKLTCLVRIHPVAHSRKETTMPRSIIRSASFANQTIRSKKANTLCLHQIEALTDWTSLTEVAESPKASPSSCCHSIAIWGHSPFAHLIDSCPFSPKGCLFSYLYSIQHLKARRWSSRMITNGSLFIMLIVPS